MKKLIVEKLSIIIVLISGIICYTACERDEGPELLNPKPINGVSSAFVSLDASGVIINEYTSQGRLTLTAQNKTPDLRKGSIITVDLDTMGYLRRVTSVKTDGDRMIVETSQAYLNDVFVDKDFKLNTALIDPDQIVSLKSTANPGNKSMIGKDGYIHPSEVVFYGENGNVKIVSASELKSAKADTISLVYFHEDFSGKDLYGKEGDNIHFYISEGYAELGSNAIFEFDFNSSGERDEDTQVERGELFYFSFYLNSKADFQTKLELDATGETSQEGEQTLFKLKRITAKFIVGGVPVWISFDVSVCGAYTFNADASLHADWGFETKNELKIGGKYDGATNTLSPISDFESQKTIYPLNVDAELNIHARLEVYPRVDALFYGFLGPFAEIVPYVEGNLNAALQTKITQDGSETFIAWDSDVNLGLVLRIGAKLDFIGKAFDEEFGPEVIYCFNDTLWYSPASIELISTIPAESQSNTTIPLTLVVKDNLGNGVNLCPVYFSGNGKFSDEIVASDTEGSIYTNWLLSDNTSGPKEFSASIFDATGEIINKVNGQTNETHSVPSIIFNPNVSYGSFTDTRDNSVYKTVQLGNQVWMAENMRYLNRVNPPSNNLGNWVYGYVGSDVNSARATDYYHIYGVLYNLNQAMSACPTGWHLPSDDEWTELESFLITNGYNFDGTLIDEKIGKSLASSYDWEFSSVQGSVGNTDYSGQRNITGFTGLPAGYRGKDGKFYALGYRTAWWSSTLQISYIVNGERITFYYYRSLSNDRTDMLGGGNSGWDIEGGISVRCIKD